jgi:hypothetical protein
VSYSPTAGWSTARRSKLRRPAAVPASGQQQGGSRLGKRWAGLEKWDVQRGKNRDGPSKE